MKQGGYRAGAGRKPKATEIELIELLTPLDSIAFKALEKGVKSGEFSYIKLFLEYRYGKPKQMIDVTTSNEDTWVAPVINIRVIDTGIPFASSEDEVDMDKDPRWSIASNK